MAYLTAIRKEDSPYIRLSSPKFDIISDDNCAERKGQVRRPLDFNKASSWKRKEKSMGQSLGYLEMRQITQGNFLLHHIKSDTRTFPPRDKPLSDRLT